MSYLVSYIRKCFTTSSEEKKKKPHTISSGPDSGREHIDRYRERTLLIMDNDEHARPVFRSNTMTVVKVPITQKEAE